MKQAVVYIVDASSSMQEWPLPCLLLPWNVAQQHVTQHYHAVAQHSASSVASIILCRTRQTQNHLAADDENDNGDDDNVKPTLQMLEYGHLTELTYGLSKTSVSVLRDLASCTTDTFTGHGGTVLQALRLAASALTSTTAGKKYERSIHVYTDAAGHAFECALTALSETVETLKALSCPVHVHALQSLVAPPTTALLATKILSADIVKSETSAVVKKEQPVNKHDDNDDDVPIKLVKEQQRQQQQQQQKEVPQIKEEAKHPDAPVKMEMDTDEKTQPPHPSPIKSTVTATTKAGIIKQEESTTDNNMEDDSETDEEEMHHSPIRSSNKRIKCDTKQQQQQHQEEDTDSNDDDEEEEEEDEEDVVVLDSREARMEFLQNLATQTNGMYCPVSSLDDLFAPSSSSSASLETAAVEPFQKDPHYAKNTLLLVPAQESGQVSDEPYAIPIRLSLLHAKQGAPTLKKGCLVFQEQDLQQQEHQDDADVDYNQPKQPKQVPQRTEQGDLIIHDTEKVTKFIQLGDPDCDVWNRGMTADAIRYGAEWQVVDATFEQAATPAHLPGPALQIIGYVAASNVDPTIVQGPCHVVTGHDSLRSCTAVCALAQALAETNRYALVLCAKTKAVKATTLGALVPSRRDENKPTALLNYSLYMVTLPYAGEVKDIGAEDWQQEVDDTQVQVASNLIDALSLSDHQAQAILNQSDPFQRAWNATVLHRAVHPQESSSTSSLDKLILPAVDTFGTPANVKENAQEVIRRFREAFPLILKKASSKEKKMKGNKALTYSNFVDEGA